MYISIPQRQPLRGLGCLCGAMGSNGDSGNAATTAAGHAISMTTVVRVALAVSAIAIVWMIYDRRRKSIHENMMAPWADIGPLFAKSLDLGTAFGLTPYL